MVTFWVLSLPGDFDAKQKRNLIGNGEIFGALFGQYRTLAPDSVFFSKFVNNFAVTLILH